MKKVFNIGISSNHLLNKLKVFFITCTLLLLTNFSNGQVVISIQDFEASPATPTLTFTNTNGAFSSGTNTGGRPATSLFASGAQGWKAVNTTSTVIFANQSLVGYTDCFVEFRLAGFNIANTTNGIDGADVATISISVDGGTTYSSEATVCASAANQYWDFSSTGTCTVTYDGDDSPTPFTSTTGAGAKTTVTVNIPNGNTQVRLKIDLLTNSVNEAYVIDDVKIKGTVSASCSGEPTAQATDITFSNVGTSGMDVSWTAGTGGDNYILVCRQGSAVTWTPTDNADYTGATGGGDFTSATDQGSGNKVVFDGPGTSATITGLSQGTTYYFQVFHYCENSSTEDYITSTGTNNTGAQNQATTTGPIKYQGFEGSSDDNWNYSGGTISASTARFYVGAKSGLMDGAQTVTFDNVDISTYENVVLSVAFSANGPDSGDDLYLDISYDGGSTWAGTGSVKLVDGFGNANIAFGATNGADPTTVASNPWTVNISSSETQIQIRFRYLGGASGDIYYIDDISLDGDVATIDPEPTNQPTSFAVGTVTTSNIPLTWTEAVNGSTPPDGYLIKAATSAVSDPSDATDPANDLSLSDNVANVKVYPKTVTAYSSFTNFTVGTMYYFGIWSYTNSGTDINFKTDGEPTLNHATLPNSVTSPVFTATSSSTANISWTKATGHSDANHTTMVFVKATSSVTVGTPDNDDSFYTANTAFGSGTAYEGDGSASCVYKGDGTSVSITGLTANTTYHILILNVVDASNSCGTNSYSSEAVANGTTYKNEPTNYPTDFTCGTTTSSEIPLTWTAAAAGSEAPDYYLIKWSYVSYAAITDPSDGTAIADDIATVGSGAKNIAYGTNNYTVPNLEQNTTYFFKIWTYTNTSTNVNYKTGSEPQTSCATLEGPCLSQLTFTATPTDWAATSVTYSGGEAVFGSMTGELATLEITNPNSLTFDLRRTSNTSAKTLYVEVSTTTQDGSYTIVATYTHGNTTADGTTACNVDLSAYSGSNAFVKFRKASSTTSPWYIDNVEVMCGACSEPTSNSTGLSFSNITSTTIDFAIATLGNGNKRIIIAKEGSAIDYEPVDATTYIANDFSASTDYNSGNRVVYNGTGTTGTIAGLTPGTTYYFKVYEYNCADPNEDYYIGGTILDGNATTSISPVTSLSVVCQTSTTATISWIAPEGSYDGVVIGVRNSTNPCHVLNGDASTYNADVVFASGYEYGIPDPPSSFVVYKGTGTTVTVTGLTAGQNYQVKAYTFKDATTWSSSTPTTSITALGTPNVSSLSASPLDAEVQVTWANPGSSCFDEVMVIASTATPTASPSGDGSSYTANSVYSTGGSGANLPAGEYCVYKGSSNSVNITGLTNDTEYCFKVFTRSGTSWSTGVSVCQTPFAGAVQFVPGSIAVVGVCSNVDACLSPPDYSAGDDEISIVCFNDITAGTMIDMTDNGWNRCTDGYWGNSEGFLRIRRTGSTITKGTIITFRLTNSSPYFEGVYPDNDWVIDVRYGSLILNTDGDQIYFMTGGAWDNGTTNNHDATYTGGVILFSFNTNNDWVDGVCSSTTYPSSSSGTGATQNSGLFPGLDCFNMMPGVATDFIKFSVDLSSAGEMSQRAWIEAIKDPDNWEAFADCDGYYDNAINNFIASETSIQIASSGGIGVTAGLWTGAGGSSNWFSCSNWDNMIIPDETVDVILPNTGVTYDCRIGDPTGTDFTEAKCNNLTNNLDHSSGFDFLIGTDDSDGGTDESLSALHVYGNFTNNATMDHDAGTVTFKGSSAQTIAGSGTTEFYNLTIDNSSTGVTLDRDVVVSNTLTFTDGKIITSGTNLLNITNTSTSAISGGVTSGSEKYVEGRLQWNTIAGTYTFPVGYNGYGAQGFDFKVNTGSGNILAYLESNNSAPTQTYAYCDFETITASGQTAGDGTCGADGIMDQIEFNIASPLQWNITNPSGGAVSNYDLTVYANGSQDITSSVATTKCGDKVKFLMKNGEPGNPGFTTITGTPFGGTGFAICPSGGASGINSLTGLTSFSKFTHDGANKANSILPVELITFNAKLKDEIVLLDWSTASEINNDYFDIERSNNGTKFNTIGKVYGSGNTTTTTNYSFIDNKPLKGLSYYRLKQVDIDGLYAYSNISSIVNSHNNLSIENIYNSEFSTILIIANDSKESFNIRITDMSGKIMYTRKLNSFNENIKLEIDKGCLSSGIYNINLYNNKSIVNQRIVIF